MVLLKLSDSVNSSKLASDDTFIYDFIIFQYAGKGVNCSSCNMTVVRDNSVSITKSATRHHVLLLNFAVRSDTQNPTLILLEQVMLPPLTPDARINTPESNLNFMKIYCNSNQNVNLVRQLITFNASKS